MLGRTATIDNCGSIKFSLSNDSRSDWDKFAARCGASFRASYNAVRGWQFDHHLINRLHRFSCHLDGVKVAQAAIGFGRRCRVFGEGLQILPEYRSLWRRLMAALLAHLGAGEYHYGSPWSLEPPRDDDLAAICGVRVTRTRSVSVFAVDFAQWSSWDCYLKAVSTNAKRNAKRATKTYREVVICRRTGFSSARDLYHLLDLRKQLFDRKEITFSWPKISLRFILRVVCMREKAFTAVAFADGVKAAAFAGVVFGDNTYYLESGSRKDNAGVSWFLQLQMLSDAFERASTGYFITGYHYEGQVVDPGLNLFRSQCRAVAYPTSEVTFVFDPGS